MAHGRCGFGCGWGVDVVGNGAGYTGGLGVTGFNGTLGILSGFGVLVVWVVVTLVVA